MSHPKLYSLGAAITDSAFYADCRLSKNALAQALNSSRPTIWRHETIAYWKIPEFKEDYPELPKQLWKEKKCARDREVPLTPYQSWVISLVKASFDQLKKKSAVESFVKENAYLFTRANYHNQLAKLAKMLAA